MAKGMKTGGRKVGTPNRATADIKAVTGAYTSEAVGVLVDLMRNETTPPAVRLAAANSLLDRLTPTNCPKIYSLKRHNEQTRH